MAISVNVMVLIVTVCLTLGNLSIAREHIVGDGSGWRLNFNYTAWAEAKEFRVGDTLVFKYPEKKHNVMKVSGQQFTECNAGADTEVMTSGYDVISLATAGRKWYVCGISNHCQMGMKLVINVFDSSWQAPSPSIASSPFALPIIPVPSSPPSLPPTSWKYPQVPAYAPIQYVVGDDSGWSLGVDYAAWAQGKTFRVGDSLVFKYTQGSHNVYKVGGPDFRACSVPAQGDVLTSGNDVITLATTGRKWYLCGVGNGAHCMAGQRLMITVVPAAGSDVQSPSPSPSSSPYFSSSHSSINRDWSPARSPMPSPSMPPVAGAPAAGTYSFFNRFLKK